MKVRNTRTIGAIVRQRRRELNLDQLALAEKIGASRYWVGQMEQGKEGAEIGRVLSALEALGLNVDISAPNTAPKQHKAHKPTHIPVVDIDAIVARAKLPLMTSIVASPANKRRRSRHSRK